MLSHTAPFSVPSMPPAGGIALAASETKTSSVHFLDAQRPDVVDRVRHNLEEEGIAFLDGISTEEDALGLARALGEIFPHRDSEPSGLTRILCRAAIAARPGFKGFSTDMLFPHTDQSCLEEPSLFLLQVCKEQAGLGGNAVLVDGRAVYEDLARRFPELLGHLGGDRAAVFSDGRNTHCGPIFESMADGSIGARFRYDSCVFFSPQLTPHVGYFLKIVESYVRQVALHPGQAYIINNRWWLHGREAFMGEREMWRILLKAGDGPFAGARVGFQLTESRRAVA